MQAIFLSFRWKGIRRSRYKGNRIICWKHFAIRGNFTLDFAYILLQILTLSFLNISLRYQAVWLTMVRRRCTFLRDWRRVSPVRLSAKKSKCWLLAVSLLSGENGNYTFETEQHDPPIVYLRRNKTTKKSVACIQNSWKIY